MIFDFSQWLSPLGYGLRRQKDFGRVFYFLRSSKTHVCGKSGSSELTPCIYSLYIKWLGWLGEGGEKSCFRCCARYRVGTHLVLGGCRICVAAGVWLSGIANLAMLRPLLWMLKADSMAQMGVKWGRIGVKSGHRFSESGLDGCEDLL